MKRWLPFNFFNSKTSPGSNLNQVKQTVVIDKQANQYNPLLLLPRDVQNIIFSYLNLSDLDALKKACELFANDENIKKIFKQIYDRYQFVSESALPLYQQLFKFCEQPTEKLKKDIFHILETQPELACDIQYLNQNIHTFFTWAVEQNQQQLLDEIYKRQCELIGDKPKGKYNGFTKLHWAILCNQSLDVIDLAIKNPFISLAGDSTGRNGGEKHPTFSPLMCAVVMNRLDVLQVMFQKNPKLNIATFIDNCEFNALMLGVIFNRDTIIDFFQQKKCNIEELSFDKAHRKNRDFLKPYLSNTKKEEARYSAKDLSELMLRTEINTKFTGAAENKVNDNAETDQSKNNLGINHRMSRY